MAKRILITCFAAVAFSAFGISAQAQSRSALSISTPGQMRSPGTSAALTDFNRYSYGLASRSAYTSFDGQNVLNSSVNSGGGNFRVPNRGGSPVGVVSQPGMPNMSSSATGTTRRLYRPNNYSVGYVDSPYGTNNNVATPRTNTRMGTQGADEGVFKGDRNSKAAPASQPADDGTVEKAPTERPKVQSLAPDIPSMYRDYMLDGERAFRRGDFVTALTRFQSANYLADTPESLVAMSHTRFAMGAYLAAADLLKKALREYPQLPQARLDPQKFYGDPSLFVENLIDLEEYVRTNPADSNAQLLMAYYAWFGGDKNGPENAHKALCMALLDDSDPQMVDAIETFHEGMVASGKVKEPLKLASGIARATEGPTAPPAAAKPGT